jgi:hypothetical protein
MASPSRIPDINALRRMNLNSIDVLAKAQQRLKELGPSFSDNPPLEDSIEAEISTVELEIRIGMIVQTRLHAASIRVNALSVEDVQQLDDRASKIDETIERDAVVTASLGTVRRFITTARELRDLVKSSTNVQA